MSGPDNIPCREAIEKLWAYIDGELPGHDTEQVHDHLEACKACYPHYDFQKAFREFIGQHMKHPVPAGLRRRVFLALLEEERTTAGGDTD
ncbi:MAG: zf-HC2 domain-containing protein [Gemmatimonadota bacterium]|jgi:anti-sigma factor (TIGR02949 family)